MKMWNVISGGASTLIVASILMFGVSTGVPSAAEAAPPACKGHNKNDPSCPGVGGLGGVKYTAQLTGGSSPMPGAFEFGSEDVTPNEKENSLQFDTNPMVRPNGNQAYTGDWLDVFTDCKALGTSGFAIPTSFQVESVIEQPGGVRVVFIGITYGAPEVSVVVQLIGTIFDGSFLPVLPSDASPGESVSIDHPMTISLVHGHTTSRGKTGHCNRTGRTGTVASTLTITATAPP